MSAVNESVSVIEGTQLSIPSSFPNNISMFNNEESYPDFFITPEDTQFHLHRSILAPRSLLFADLFRGNNSVYATFDKTEQRVDLLKANAVCRKALSKWLRFCYGEDQVFDADDCPAALAVLLQLKLNNENDVVEKLVKFMSDVSRNDAEKGIRILIQCAREYNDKNDERMQIASERIANSVFSVDHLEKKFESMMDCLMKLPSVFLDHIQYGEVNTRTSEFSIRRMYVEKNEVTPEERQKIMKMTEESRLSCKEIEELETMGIIGNEQIKQMYQKALENAEIVIAQLKDENQALKKENDQLKITSEQAKISSVTKNLPELEEKEHLKQILPKEEKKEQAEQGGMSVDDERKSCMNEGLFEKLSRIHFC